MKPNLRNEPVTLPSLILGAVTAFLALLVGQGVIDPDLSAALLGFVAAVIPLVGFFVQRPKVTPVASVQVSEDKS